MNSVGFYGKLAGRGDFVSRGLPNTFVEPWDAWLASGMRASQDELGAAWLDAYLTSPPRSAFAGSRQATVSGK